MQKHLALLGYPVKDKATGFVGVVTSISFELFGCIQAVVSPPVDKEGKQPAGAWFDINRLEKTGDKPVMDVPSFATDKQGGAEKPAMSSNPIR